MQVTLAQPQGFCAGVVRAIEIVERALEIHGTPVYILHEIVHNPHVIGGLRARGAVFVETLDQVPPGSVTIFSAHGVSTAVVARAEARNLHVIDASCPLVSKVHQQALRYANQGFEIIIIGHPTHPEVQGTRGRIPGPSYTLSKPEEVATLAVRNPLRLAYVTQTTLSVDDTRDVIAALKQRFPNIQGPNVDDICYATQNRQNAVRWLADRVDLLLVVGAQNSSNSNRLREVGSQAGVPAHLIQDARDLQSEWLTPDMRIGITAGASTPEVLVQGVLARLQDVGVRSITKMEAEPETVTFPLPEMGTRRLRHANAAAGSDTRGMS